MSVGYLLNASAISGMDKFKSLARVAAGSCPEEDRLPASVLSDSQLITRAQQLFPDKPYCLVRDWVLVDVDDHESLLLPEGVKPRVVFAGKVVDDKAERFHRPRWLRSSFEVSFVEDCFFESMNTVYVLAGGGARASCGWIILNGSFW
ncbi:DUF6957 family protein [Pseudomonas aeruginosa]|uniref:DUF6957 family protein n=1 Tax=Pseudomonas aeruginosa TaxID=287 RepID=UPI001F4B2F07|nr:hypothetical protein [Pseudomonas aeruginosa]